MDRKHSALPALPERYNCIGESARVWGLSHCQHKVQISKGEHNFVFRLVGLYFWYIGRLDYVFGILDNWTTFLVYWTAGLCFGYIGQLDYVFGILDSWTMFLV